MTKKFFKNESWKPPPKNSIADPYKEAYTRKQILEFVGDNQHFRKGSLNIEGTSSEYCTPQEYQQKTGVRFNTNILLSNKAFEKITGSLEDDSVIKIIEGKFIIKESGLYFIVKKGKTEEEQKICNFGFDIEVIQILHNRDGSQKEEILYHLVGKDIVKNSDGEPEVIEAENYHKLYDNILKYHKECYICPESRHIAKDRIKEYGALLYRDKRKACTPLNYYSYHGWEIVNGKKVYLSDSRSDCKCGIFVPKISPEDEIRTWFDDLKILEIGKKVDDPNVPEYERYNVSLPFWLYLHVSFACKLFLDAGIEVQFLLALIGKTGSLKTSICKAFAEAFNSGEMLRFESTERALELYRESCIDMIMIVDDIFKKDNSNTAKFEDILRVFGDGIGRAKSAGKDFNDIVRTKVRGGCIVTAEHDLNSQQSSTLRYISVNVEKDSIDTAILSEFQEDQIKAKIEGKPSRVQNIFGGWIQFLERNYDRLVEMIAKSIRSDLPFKFKRHNQIYNVVMITAKLILIWGLEINAISQSKAQEYQDIWCDIIIDLICKNQEMAIQAEPWQQFLIALQKAISTGNAKLAYTKEEFEKNGKNYVGYHRGDEYVLTPDKVMALIKRQMWESGKGLVAEPITIYKEIFEHHISLGYDNQKDGRGRTRKRYLKRTKLNGHLVEMLVIPIESLELAVNLILGEE